MVPVESTASWATNSQSSVLSGGVAMAFAGGKLPSLPARFGGASVPAHGGGLQFGRESPHAGPNPYNRSKFVGAPAYLYYNTTPGYASTAR